MQASVFLKNFPGGSDILSRALQQKHLSNFTCESFGALVTNADFIPAQVQSGA